MSSPIFVLEALALIAVPLVIVVCASKIITDAKEKQSALKANLGRIRAKVTENLLRKSEEATKARESWEADIWHLGIDERRLEPGSRWSAKPRQWRATVEQRPHRAPLGTQRWTN